MTSLGWLVADVNSAEDNLSESPDRKAGIQHTSFSPGLEKCTVYFLCLFSGKLFFIAFVQH